VRLSRLRVPAGYAAGLAALVLARPYPLSLAVGGALAVTGEALRIWASGHIDKTENLATGGPYALTRNPLYLGSLLVGLGVAVAAASAGAAVLAVAYFAVFYPAVMVEEARFLRAKFASEYDRWAAAVPMFLPRLWPAGPRASRFAWRRVARNREWRTALAVPVLALALYARARWLP
jgi:protein-S-isoprenylcysteine O-methyltransferase Ste14